MRFQDRPSSPDLAATTKSFNEASTKEISEQDIPLGKRTGSKAKESKFPFPSRTKSSGSSPGSSPGSGKGSPTLKKSVMLMKRGKKPAFDRFVQIANKNLPEPHENFRLWVLTPLSRSSKGQLEAPGTLADPKALLKLYAKAQLAVWQGHQALVPQQAHINHILDSFLYSCQMTHRYDELREEFIALMRALAIVLNGYQEQQHSLDEGQKIDINLPVQLMKTYLASRLERSDKLYAGLRKMAKETFGDSCSVTSRVTADTKTTAESELTSTEGNLLDDFAYTLAKFAKLILDEKDVVDNFLESFETAVSAAIWLFVDKDKS
mmetsp:Transcript_24039/g.31057  ORF Transcript_24039/g.31057 Transcript_24039/m.31057 type:complete len:321 (+) Transcript_24039:1-963(+)